MVLILPASAGEAERLVQQLGSQDFERREAAEATLITAGSDVETLLRQAQGSPDPEVAQRASRILRLRRPEVSPEDLLEEPAYVGREVVCAGVFRALCDDRKGWLSSEILTVPSGISIPVRLNGIPGATLGSLVDREILLNGKVVRGPEGLLLEGRAMEARRIGFDIDLPILTARAALAERDERYGMELCLVGILQPKGGIIQEGICLESPESPGWLPIDLASGYPYRRPDPKEWLGKKVVIRGYLFEAREDTGPTPRWPAMRIRAIREASPEDLAKDIPGGSSPPRLERQGRGGG